MYYSTVGIPHCLNKGTGGKKKKMSLFLMVLSSLHTSAFSEFPEGFKCHGCC